MATHFQASLASMDRILDVLEVKPTIINSPNAVSLKETSDGITFENLSFAYIEGTKVLKKISFKIAPGEAVAMVGHTGAGKTTVAALVNRFYDPQEGRILIGDQDIRDVTLESLHDTIALIAQEPYLFDANVLENIRYGRQSATDQEIVDLCKLIGAHEFIEVLSNLVHQLIAQG